MSSHGWSSSTTVGGSTNSVTPSSPNQYQFPPTLELQTAVQNLCSFSDLWCF